MSSRIGIQFLEGSALFQYQFFLWLHILGISLVLLALGASFMMALSNKDQILKYKKIVFVVNGIGLIFTIVSGFGMLMKLALLGNLGSWIWPKIFIWLAMGFLPSISLILPKMAVWVTVICVFLIGFASALSFFKPF